ncbi:PREDICTED: dynein heavy chain 3, axonemal-like [Priapulus caudatus]|uniref:Dynein heavy chain 3, axonemal-like n=1 Tax=Priapulus caudatus TaxID=37621 RepID=A0ABM1EVZ2_PRICU|nr:PREDICTED: dynein heavy chain 3, axonemal-like [Priapulus caudatus]
MDSNNRDWQACSASRPASPLEQIEIMEHHELQESRSEQEPSSSDLEKYKFYIENGIKGAMLAVPPSDQMKNVERRICVARGMGAKHKKKLLEELNTEVENNYRFSLQQAIVDYILKDPHERGL